MISPAAALRPGGRAAGKGIRGGAFAELANHETAVGG